MATAAIINLAIGLGGALGSSFVKNPALQNVIGTAVVGTQNFVTAITGKTNVAAASFSAAFSTAIAILQTEGKITADEAAELNKAVAATFAADQAAQQVIDPTTLTPLAPLS